MTKEKKILIKIALPRIKVKDHYRNAPFPPEEPKVEKKLIIICSDCGNNIDITKDIKDMSVEQFKKLRNL